MYKINNFKILFSLVERNTKSYFKNKFMFFMSLITPLILLILFVTFLRNVYIDSIKNALPSEIQISGRLINGLAGAWLMSSILSVSSVTVAFCSNIVMIEDKIYGNILDFKVAPVKSTTVSLSYFISNFFVTFAVMMCVMLIGHIYLAAVGWYITVGDFFMIIVDCICGVLFGTLLAGIVENFVNTQGGLSAVSTLVSSMYGFICGAYMPLSSFSSGLRSVLGLLPGTYGVGILRNHYMNGYIKELTDLGVPQGNINGIKNGFDINLFVFDNKIPLGAMYGILLGACLILFAAFVVMILLKDKKKRSKKQL